MLHHLQQHHKDKLHPPPAAWAKGQATLNKYFATPLLTSSWRAKEHNTKHQHFFDKDMQPFSVVNYEETQEEHVCGRKVSGTESEWNLLFLHQDTCRKETSLPLINCPLKCASGTSISCSSCYLSSSVFSIAGDIVNCQTSQLLPVNVDILIA